MAKRKPKQRKTVVAVASRNPLFNHPLMKKSHRHDITNKAKRRAEKISIARDWYAQSCFTLKTILNIPVATTF